MINQLSWKELRVEGKQQEGPKNKRLQFSLLEKENWGTKKIVYQETTSTHLYLRLGWKDMLELQC